MSGKSTVKTVLVIVILVLVGILGVFGLNTAKTYMSGATIGYDPQGVKAEPSDDGKSAVISWTTEKPVMAVVEYGTTPASLLLKAIESEQGVSHKVTISPLKPNTSYYYRILVREKNDEDTIYDNGGIPFSFKTKTGDGSTAKNPTPTISSMISQTPTKTLPTAAASTGGCNRTTDYDKDGIVNSLDFMSCMKNGGGVGPTGAVGTTSPVVVSPTGVGSTKTSLTPTVATSCKGDVDYNKDGLINVKDMLKCRQDGSR